VKNTYLLLLTMRFTQKQSNAEAHQIKLIEATVAFVKPVFRMTENSLDSSCFPLQLQKKTHIA
jgi:hypothetical protein